MGFYTTDDSAWQLSAHQLLLNSVGREMVRQALCAASLSVDRAVYEKGCDSTLLWVGG